MNDLELKLNDEKALFKMAEFVLIRFGKEYHQFSDYVEIQTQYWISYIFEGLPDKKIWIQGIRDYSKEKDVTDFLRDVPRKFNINTIQEYHRLVMNNQFSFKEIGIKWNDNPLIINSLNLSEISQDDLGKDFDNRKDVFEMNDKELIKFVKGPWQEYLAKVYYSNLRFCDFVK